MRYLALLALLVVLGCAQRHDLPSSSIASPAAAAQQ
jgi:hypothetical protein